MVSYLNDNDLIETKCVNEPKKYVILEWVNYLI